MTKLITSLHNPLIKNILILREKPRERRDQMLFIIEGIREIKLAAQSGYPIKTLIYCPDILPVTEFEALINDFDFPSEPIEVSQEIFNRIAYRGNNGGLLAIASQIELSLNQLILPSNPLILILESIEKPGNLGAILRTADAAGISATILCDTQTDIFNPNTIRASLGTVFTNQLAVAPSTNTLEWLHRLGIKIFVTSLTGVIGYHQVSFCEPSAIILGSEAHGVTKIWNDNADQVIKIPMSGKVDSLNVSTSAAIIVFEAIRQRSE